MSRITAQAVHWLFRLREIRMRRAFNRRGHRLARRLGLQAHAPDRSGMAEHEAVWSPVARRVDPVWYRIYGHVFGRGDIRFIPLDVYYVLVEPVLNNARFSLAFGDKNGYDLCHGDLRKPRDFIRHIEGSYYDRSYRRIPEDALQASFLPEGLIDADTGTVLVKPAIDTRQGQWIRKLWFRDGMLHDATGCVVTLATLARDYRRDFLVQECIRQHACTARFNDSSVNSLRVYTYRSVDDDTVIPLHVLQKVGVAGHLVDQGLRIGVRPSGHYNPFCTDENGTRYDAVNGMALGAIEPFPFMDELRKQAVEVAERFIHQRVLGLDFAVREDGEILLLEANTRFIGLDNLQFHHGPLFGEFTQEVIDFCRSAPRTELLSTILR
ncbi:sugar-transfer associated ATP-grasp domain-containing protein [Thioalkalivibrio thiocyanodenitrificans]|uniref:sugar-transfer associated ATP-grasp domain-containing protein n=1 Tax=Thioalkalivibrio thiocyanodenitrificans TaxID=243063 RepID=UPI0012EA3666|nr:sugar-transfer associated ATP-grasp domain-containing protein [Thioalkalivibrio thiocyanodenitrificans]